MSKKRNIQGKSGHVSILRQPCRYFLKSTCTRTSCEYWHPPECLFYKNETGCKAGDKCLFPHYKVDEQPNKKPQKEQLPKKKTKRCQECCGYCEKCITIGLCITRFRCTLNAKDQSRIHQFGKKVLPGLFLGYALYAGRIWKVDVLIADLEELETMDASEISSKRLNAKEVIFPKQGEFILPIADGRVKNLGGDQELRTSNLVRHRPIQGESNIDFLGESEGSLPQPHDSLPDAGEAIKDFWSMSGNFMFRHHVEPRVKLYSPREESFPLSLKYIDVTRTTHTNLDVMQERRIDDY